MPGDGPTVLGDNLAAPGEEGELLDLLLAPAVTLPGLQAPVSIITLTRIAVTVSGLVGFVVCI